MIIIYYAPIPHNVWNIQCVFAWNLYLKLVENQEHIDQYITMYTAIYHLIEYLTKGMVVKM